MDAFRGRQVVIVHRAGTLGTVHCQWLGTENAPVAEDRTDRHQCQGPWDTTLIRRRAAQNADGVTLA